MTLTATNGPIGWTETTRPTTETLKRFTTIRATKCAKRQSLWRRKLGRLAPPPSRTSIWNGDFGAKTTRMKAAAQTLKSDTVARRPPSSLAIKKVSNNITTM